MKTNLDKNKKYILACSYGPDSMALFSYLIKEKIYFEIAHVNYHILKQANDDEIGIRNEAKKYNIKVHVLETNMPKGVNEEDRAREIRYEYFKEVAIKTNIKDVLVAHNEDDLIETYLLQKERNNIVSYFGLKEVLNRNEYNVIRPLLGYTKKELLDYCKINQIPYSIDPSNSDVKFKRNKYRKEVINNLTKDDRINLLREIDEKNKEIAAFLINTKVYYKNNKLNIDDKFKEEIDDKNFELVLIDYLRKKNIYTPISKGEAKEIYIAIKERKGNWKYKLNDKYYLFYEYGFLSIHELQNKYIYEIDKPDVPGIFVINSKAKNFEILKDKFPLIIKNVNPNDVYFYDKKTLKVNREFISWKVPLSIRDIWPGIYDKEMNLIYVPHYQSGKINQEGLLKFNLNDIYE